MLRLVEGIPTPTRGIARLVEALILIQRLATKPAPSLKTSQLWGSSFWPRREISATRTMGSRKRLRESRSLPARGVQKGSQRIPRIFWIQTIFTKEVVQHASVGERKPDFLVGIAPYLFGQGGLFADLSPSFETGS